VGCGRFGRQHGVHPQYDHSPPQEIEGYAFLLNDKGELVDQERPDMFIPPAGGAIRSKMIAGDVDHDYDAAAATDVFYAPIYSADGKSFWSLGFSMREAEIARLADPIRKKRKKCSSCAHLSAPPSLSWSSWS